MGKGSGECSRPALTLISAGGHDRVPGARRWETEEDRDQLRAALADTRGADHWVIQERLRRLAGGRERDYGWDTFSWESTIADAREHPGQLHPVFVRGGSAADGVAYVEHHRIRRPGQATTYPISDDIKFNHYNNLPEQLKAPSPTDRNLPWPKQMSWQHRWTGMLREIVHNPITCHGDKPTVDEVFEHAEAYLTEGTADFWLSLTDEERLTIVKYIVERTGASSTTGTKIRHWDFVGDAQWRVEADITVKDESKVIEALIRAGARVEDREIELPEYSSVHDIEGGKGYIVDVDDGLLEYVPHHSVGIQPVAYAHYRIAWSPSSEQLDELRAKIDAHFATRLHTADEMVVRVRKYPDGSIIVGARIVELASIDEKYRDSVASAADEGGSIKRKDWVDHYHRPTDEEIDKIGVYRRVGDGWMRKRHAASREKQMQSIDAMDQEWRWNFERDDDAAAPRFHKSPSTDDERRESDAWQAFEGRVRQTAKNQHWPPGVLRLLTEDDGRLRSSVETRIDTVTRRERIGHSAPLSERGVIRVTGVEPQRAMAKLRELGVVGETETDVPWGLVYNDGPRRGRVLPFLDAYATGDTPLVTPPAAAALHGMTGVRNDRQAIERFALMVRGGGLKSIAERRRLGLASATSMSPRGDIASGIDGGVPCKIGSIPVYGSYVVFALKPDALARRDLWFSNVDFGGGHNRYDKYNAYAKSIGQGKMHRPPSDQARQKHYDTGLDDDDNEVYFKNEVPWGHVDTVYIKSGACYDALKPMIDAWKSEGILPPSLRVRDYDGYRHSLEDPIKQRSNAISSPFA